MVGKISGKYTLCHWKCTIYDILYKAFMPLRTLNLRFTDKKVLSREKFVNPDRNALIAQNYLPTGDSFPVAIALFQDFAKS